MARLRLWAVWSMALFLLAGARAGAVTVKLTDADASSTVILHVGDRLRLELATAPATGFRWAEKKLDASRLEELSHGIRPESRRLDTAGTQLFAWKALSPGQAEVALEYSRPNDDRTIPPARHMELKVEVAAGELAPASPGADDLLTQGPALLATYQGTLACGDCLGIGVNLALYLPAAKENASKSDVTGGVFVERRRYQGAPGGDRTIAGTGKFAVLHGTYADPSMTVYVLGAPDGSIENFKVENEQLTLLDGQMLPLPAPSGRDTALHRLVNEGN